MEKTEVVAIIGSGIVGKSWAMLFASGGHRVRLFDSNSVALKLALEDIQHKLKNLEQNGTLKNSSKFNGKAQAGLITTCSTLEDALEGVTYIQECTPELLEVKRSVFLGLDQTLTKIGNTEAIIGSSSSAIPSSKFVSGLGIQDRTLVVHPVNPPYFIRLVEVIPNEMTKVEVTSKVRHLLTSIGQAPVVLKKEVAGFALNRVQYAILNSTWKLIKEGILSVKDADTVTREGLAPRYVFMGPLETTQLNANGFLDYCSRYGQTIYDVSLESQSNIPKFTSEEAQEIDQGLQALVPNSDLGNRRLWRDQNLAHLAQFKRKLSL